jgi:hypothetical protein
MVPYGRRLGWLMFNSMESVLSSLEGMHISKSCVKICLYKFIAFFVSDPFTVPKSVKSRPPEYFDVFLILLKPSLTHCAL